MEGQKDHSPLLQKYRIWGLSAFNAYAGGIGGKVSGHRQSEIHGIPPAYRETVEQFSLAQFPERSVEVINVGTAQDEFNQHVPRGIEVRWKTGEKPLRCGPEPKDRIHEYRPPSGSPFLVGFFGNFCDVIYRLGSIWASKQVTGLPCK